MIFSMLYMAAHARLRTGSCSCSSYSQKLKSHCTNVRDCPWPARLAIGNTSIIEWHEHIGAISYDMLLIWGLSATGLATFRM